MKDLDKLLEEMVESLQSTFSFENKSVLNKSKSLEKEEISITLKVCRYNPKTGKKECITGNVYSS